ncbi:hypothetical protein HZB60_11180 [candidate division KSB1 bacterium]|nr:hypothetical protein [candidate division KSB1 bacterium]
MLRHLAFPALFLLLALTLSVNASSSDNFPAADRAPLARIEETAPGTSTPASGWNATVDVIGRLGSVSVLAVALAPQSMADATAAGLHAIDLPGQIGAACSAVGDFCRTCGSTTIHVVKETVHWLALPLYVVRHLVRSLPAPALPW